MAESAYWDEIDQLVVAVGGRDEQISEVISKIGPECVAEILIDEILTRWDAPAASQESTVNIDLEFEGRIYSYQAEFKGNELAIERGRADEVLAVLRYSLVDLTRLLYPHRPSCLPASREVAIMAWPQTSIDIDPEQMARMMERKEIDRETLAITMFRKSEVLLQSLQSILNACSSALDTVGHLSSLYFLDKWGFINTFAAHYEDHFSAMRHDPIRLLEIGIGGYEFGTLGGGSLRMWQRFFPRGLIYGLDIHEKPEVTGPRIRTIKADQSDAAALREIATAIGPIDIVIDDGSHVNDHVRTTYETLFPFVRPGGYYVIEDLQTSYWPEFGGELPPGSSRTTAGMLKDLIDRIHFREYADVPDDEARNMNHPSDVFIYRNIAFLRKGMNHEQASPEWMRIGAKIRKHLENNG